MNQYYFSWRQWSVEKRIIFMTLVFTILIFLSWQVLAHGGEDHGDAITSDAHSFPIVTITKAQLASESEGSLQVAGTVLSLNETDVFPLRDGIVQSMSVDVGTFVRKGQAVATLSLEQGMAGIAADIIYQRERIKNLKQQKIPLQKSMIARDVESQEQEIATLEQRKLLLSGNLTDIRKNILTTEYNTTLKSNAVKITALEEQVAIIEEQIDKRSALSRNAVADVLDNVATLLYVDKRRLLTGGSISGPRPDLISVQKAAHIMHNSFRLFYKKFFATTEVSLEQITATQEYAKQARIFVNALIPVELSADQITQLRKDLDKAIDELGEVSNDMVDLYIEVKDLEAQKQNLIAQNQQEGVQKASNLQTLQGENQLDLAEIDLEIVQKRNEIEQLKNRGELSLSEIDLEIAEANAQIKKLQSQIGWGSVVTAPFDGMVTRRSVSVGQSVGSDKPLFSIVNDQKKFVRFTVSESEFPFVKIGKLVSFSPTSAPSQTTKVAITRIGGALDPQTRRVVIEADIIDQKDLERLLTNMRCTSAYSIF